MIKKFEIFEDIYWWKDGKLEPEEEDFEEIEDNEYVKKTLINRLKKIKAQMDNLHGNLHPNRYGIYFHNYQKFLSLKAEEENILKKLKKLI